MASQKKLVICLVLSLLNVCLSLPAPAPQLSNNIPGSSFETSSQDDEDYYYEEYVEEDNDSGPPALPDLTGLLGAIGSQLPGLIQLVQTKEFQERIGDTIEVGGNIVQRIVIPVASRVIPVAINLAGRVPELLQAGGNIVRAGTEALGTLNRRPEFDLKNTEDEMMASPARVISSLVKATKDTSPRVIKGLTEFDESLPTIAQFAQAYLEVNAETVHKTADTFHNSFNCDFECRGLTGSIRRRCEAKFCKNSTTPKSQRTPRMRKFIRF